MTEPDERPDSPSDGVEQPEPERDDPVDEVRVEPPEPDDSLMKEVNLGEDYDDGGFTIERIEEIDSAGSDSNAE